MREDNPIRNRSAKGSNCVILTCMILAIVLASSSSVPGNHLLSSGFEKSRASGTRRITLEATEASGLTGLRDFSISSGKTTMTGYFYNKYYSGVGCNGTQTFIQGYATGMCLPTASGGLVMSCFNGTYITIAQYNTTMCLGIASGVVYHPMNTCFQIGMTAYGASFSGSCSKSTDGFPITSKAIIESSYAGVANTCNADDTSNRPVTFKAFLEKTCSPVATTILRNQYTCGDKSRYSIDDGFTSACSSGYGKITNSSKCLSSNGIQATTVVTNTQRGTGCLAGCRAMFPECVGTAPPTSQPSSLPSGQPSSEPSGVPSGQPSSMPSGQPSSEPSGVPTNQPTSMPSGQPSSEPSGVPTNQPTSEPSGQPSSQPSGVPTNQPSSMPSGQPSSEPSGVPTNQPTSMPSGQPSSEPSGVPTNQPTSEPSGQPSGQPTSVPTNQPTSMPSGQPSSEPSGVPTNQPSSMPSGQPSSEPSSLPTNQPTSMPSGQPSSEPSGVPTNQPTSMPSGQPSSEPSGLPSSRPFAEPSGQPSGQPTSQPSRQPSSRPSGPTDSPTQPPSAEPIEPSAAPTEQPTQNPTQHPSAEPIEPSAAPTEQPTQNPTQHPSAEPIAPSAAPTEHPTHDPTQHPSAQPIAPSAVPTTPTPSHNPSVPPITPVLRQFLLDAEEALSSRLALSSGENMTLSRGENITFSAVCDWVRFGACKECPVLPPISIVTQAKDYRCYSTTPTASPTSIPTATPTSARPSPRPTSQPTILPGNPTPRPTIQRTAKLHIKQRLYGVDLVDAELDSFKLVMRRAVSTAMNIKLEECVRVEFEFVKKNNRMLMNMSDSVFGLYDVEVINGNTTTLANTFVRSSKDGSLARHITAYAGFEVELDPPTIIKFTESPTSSPSSSPTHALQVVYTGTQQLTGITFDMANTTNFRESYMKSVADILEGIPYDGSVTSVIMIFIRPAVLPSVGVIIQTRIRAGGLTIQKVITALGGRGMTTAMARNGYPGIVSVEVSVTDDQRKSSNVEDPYKLLAFLSLLIVPIIIVLVFACCRRRRSSANCGLFPPNASRLRQNAYAADDPPQSPPQYSTRHSARAVACADVSSKSWASMSAFGSMRGFDKFRPFGSFGTSIKL